MAGLHDLGRTEITHNILETVERQQCPATIQNNLATVYQHPGNHTEHPRNSIATLC